MAYEYITKYDALRYTQGRDGQSIKEIVIHHWGKDGQTFQGVINWFCKNSSCPTSAHYVVEAGKVACLVNQSDTAWHAGNWYHNTTSLGIECRPEMSQGDLETVAELIAQLWKDIGQKVPLVGHRDIVSTYCPGRYYAQLGYLKALAESYYSGANKPVAKAEAPKATKTVAQLASEVINGYWGTGQDRANRLTSAGYDYRAVQDEVNRILLGTPSTAKSIGELATEVIQGKWGNGEARRKNLVSAGYDYIAVQEEVNRRFS